MTVVDHHHSELMKPGVAHMILCQKKLTNGEVIRGVQLSPLPSHKFNYEKYVVSDLTEEELQLIYDAMSGTEVNRICLELLKEREDGNGLES